MDAAVSNVVLRVKPLDQLVKELGHFSFCQAKTFLWFDILRKVLCSDHVPMRVRDGSSLPVGEIGLVQHASYSIHLQQVLDVHLEVQTILSNLHFLVTVYLFTLTTAYETAAESLVAGDEGKRDVTRCEFFSILQLGSEYLLRCLL